VSVKLQDTLTNNLLALPGLEERRSGWQDSEALWYRGKEVLHFDSPDFVDLRLGRQAIRAKRETQLSDTRVILRGTSDWINVRLISPEDVDFIVGLVRDILIV
jgi:hypothetical protein